MKPNRVRTVPKVAARVGAVFSVMLPATAAFAEEQDYGGLARAYADTMIEHGRDRYNEPTPQFLVMLSREEKPETVHEGNIARLSTKVLPGWQTRYYDRAWGGANLADHIQLHELLVLMSEQTGDPKYREASDAELSFVFKKTQSPATGLLMWGEHLSYDVRDDRVYNGMKPEGTPHSDTHEVKDPLTPAFWDRIYKVAPDEAFKFAKGLWDHQIFDQSTGQFSRHAKYTAHGPERYGASFPRVGGWMIHAWSQAYRRSTDPAYRDTMLKAITTLTTFYENVRNPVTGAIPMGKTAEGDKNPGRLFSESYVIENNLLFAIELERAIEGLPPELTKRLRNLMRGQDEVVLTKLKHNFDGQVPNAPQGYLARASADQLAPDGTLQPGPVSAGNEQASDWYTSDWSYGYGSPVTAEVAGLMVERYRTTKDERYLPLIKLAADRYLTIDPPAKKTAPHGLAEAINLMLASHQLTGEQKYLDRAVHFGELAKKMFLDGSPLPRATSSHNHYEAITGGDNLMLALWNLAQSPRLQGNNKLVAPR